MVGRIILYVCIVGISNAVFVDTSEKHNKEVVKPSPQGWQMVKVYHPHAQAHGYRYEHYAYPKYEFEYSVSDKQTGDQKHHHEVRDGDQVRGEYSLVESDGSLRKVQYHADDHNGFNAIVSNTVNKHGDHAVSVSDHTRFFYPVGHNVKINHYFPGKDYQYQNIENSEISKPVHEEPSVSNNGNEKMVMIEAGNKLMLLEPVKIEDEGNEPALKEVASTSKTEAAPVPVQIIPAVVSVVPQNTKENKANSEPAIPEPMVEKTVELSPNELTSTNESEKLKKEDQDSEVASSFFHSKFYYVGF